ncbi:MAG: sigma-54-dependent Fis family transcriptional regulator [Chlorobi bacterium]|nr:sigma-54-dependent Fis family transcriptional regulator [Chlorobiota bacterium]
MIKINPSEFSILVVDDIPNNLQVLGSTLKRENFKVEFAINGKYALEWLYKREFDLILLDIMMPEMDGFETCSIIRKNEKYNDLPVIFLTAKNDTKDIIEGFKIGAQDYITKPFDEEELIARVKTHLMIRKMSLQMQELVNQRTAELQKTHEELVISLKQLEILKNKLQDENIYMQEEIKLNHNFENIIGKSKKLTKVLHSVENVAKTDSTVLVLGETGSGKELIARSVHNLSKRSNKPLIKINCASLPSNLIESELFGHEKGAFTDAHKERKGKFELANEGTIFLDEIGEIPFELQAKLLRVLQEGEFERLGSDEIVKVDVRVIVATNRDLEKMVEEQKFRADLYYRLNVYPIKLPSLRERKEDIPLLVNYFIKTISKKTGKTITGISDESMNILQNYNWPGNIRELENIIERNIIISQSNVLKIDNTLMPPNLIQTSDSDEFDTLDNIIRKHILRILELTNWTISGSKGAAEILGLHPNTLRSRMEKLNIKKSVNYK